VTDDKETQLDDIVDRAARALRDAPAPHDPPQEVLAAVKAALAAAYGLPEPKQRKKGIFTMNRIMKIAAVFVVAAGLVGILAWAMGYGSQSAMAQLAQAMEGTRNAEWMHFAGIQGQPGEVWISARPARMAAKMPGRMLFVAADQMMESVYDARTGILQISAIQEPDSRIVDAANVLEMLLRQFEKAVKENGAKLSRRTERVGGREYIVFSYAGSDPSQGYQEFELKVDPAANRIVTIRAGGNAYPQPVTVDVDYPPTGPTDIYALGVPKDAPISVHSGTPQNPRSATTQGK